MASTIIFIIATWLGLNAAYLARRLYVTADRELSGDRHLVGQPRLIN